jgi:hypothetical protein
VFFTSTRSHEDELFNKTVGRGRSPGLKELAG